MKKIKTFNVAVVGATGEVGEEMTRILEERNFPVTEIFLYASHCSVGKEYQFKGKVIRVK